MRAAQCALHHRLEYRLSVRFLIAGSHTPRCGSIADVHSCVSRFAARAQLLGDVSDQTFGHGIRTSFG